VTGPVDIIANFARDTADDDGDGLSNYQELIVYNTIPTDSDSDDDLVEDGDEVNTTQTNPRVSQLAAVNYIIAELGNGAGPGDVVLARNEVGNTLTLKVKAAAATTLADWSDLTSASPGVSAVNGNGDFLLQVPGTADPKRFFRMEGVEP